MKENNIVFMRRTDREVTDINTIKYILDSAKVLHLGLVDDSKPYIVPMNYGYAFENNHLVFYVHSALEGRKIDVIKKNSSCCVEIECDGSLIENEIACKYGYSFYSLEGFGITQIIDDPNKKIEALSLLMKAQTGKDFEFTKEMVLNVHVIKIVCDTYSVKHRAKPE